MDGGSSCHPYSLVGDKRKVEALKNHGQSDNRFQHGKLVPNALTRTSAEGYVSADCPNAVREEDNTFHLKTIKLAKFFSRQCKCPSPVLYTVDLILLARSQEDSERNQSIESTITKQGP